MPRHLHPNGVPAFLTSQGLGDTCENCRSGNLTVTVWDHYGTAPEDGTPEAEAGTGTFLAAVIVCKDCDHGVTLDRARLAGKEASEFTVLPPI